MMEQKSEQAAGRPEQLQRGDLRPALIGDAAVLELYGPVLRRLGVGLLEEVGELTVVSLGDTRVLDFVPSPPVRIVRETRTYRPRNWQADLTGRQISVSASPLAVMDRVFSHQRLLRLLEVLEPCKPTLLHALSERQIGVARRLSKLLRVPYVASALDQDYDGRGFSENRCRAILPCFSQTARRLREKLGKPLAKRVRWVGIGTHVGDQQHVFSKDDQPSHVLACTPLEYGYGVTALINAVKRAHDKGLLCHLTLSGRGQSESTFRRQMRELGLVGFVHFVDPIPVLVPEAEAFRKVLKDVDVFVQPWAARQFRPELLEALSVGTAVIAADGAHDDLVIDGKTGLRVAEGDDEGLSAALVKVLGEREYAEQLGEGARAHLRKHFLVSHMIETLVETYRKALRAGRGEIISTGRSR